MCASSPSLSLLICHLIQTVYSYQIAYGRFSPVKQDCRELDLFVRHKDGRKLLDPEKQNALSSRLKVEMLHPLRVTVADRGPDTELLVANPVELCGQGRPRVFYDVTFALKILGICIFSVSISDLVSYEVMHKNLEQTQHCCINTIILLTVRRKSTLRNTSCRDDDTRTW